MANVIQIKRGSGTPTTSDLAQYELAYDYTNDKLYIHDPTNSSGNEIVEVGGGGATTSGSNNQLLTDDGSGGINSESSLLFSGSTLEINNSGDWSYIKNNTNSGGLRLGTKDSGGTFANQIEISNTGNYVKLNENTTVTGKVEASGKLKSTMTGGFTIGNVAGEDRIQNSSNSFSFLTDGNAYAGMTFGTVTAGTWQGTAINATYVGNLPASKITSGAFDMDRLPTKDEDNMSSNSASHVPTQQSVKAYVDSQSGGISFNGSTANGLLTYGNSTTADVESELTYNSGELKVNRSGSVTNKVTITGGSTAVLDLNSTGDSFIEKDTGNSLYIANNAQDKDVYIRVNDGGSNVNALHIDASAAGALNVPKGKIYHSGEDLYIQATSQGLLLQTGGANTRYNLTNAGVHNVYGNTSFSSPMSVNYGATFNEGGHNSDFRVESQNQTHQLHVDASADIVKTVNLRDDRTHIGYTSGHGLEPNQMSIQDWCDLPTGFHGMMRSGNQSYGNPGSTYFYFHKLSQRDSGGGWGGIALAYNSNAEFYVGHTQTNSSYATWSKVWNQANDGSGSGLDADLLDGVHASGFWQNSGTWNGANFSGSRHRGITINGGEISIQRDHPNNSQVSVLVDGGYSAGENNGFWSLYSGNSWNNRVGFYSNSSGVGIFNTTHSSGDWNFQVNGSSKMYIDGSASRIGISTTSPSFKLDVAGDARVQDVLYLEGNGDQMLRFSRSGADVVSIEQDSSQLYFYNRTTSKVLFLMSENGSARLGHNSNPSLELRNTATSTGSGPSLIFGHDQSGTNSVARISSYLTDGSQSGRAGHLRFWTRQGGTESLAMQLQANNYLRLYQAGDTTDYLELYVTDTRAYYHHAHTGSSGAYHRFVTDNGYIELGPANTGWGHINTDRGKFYFNNKIVVDSGIVAAYDEDLQLRRTYDGTADRIVIEADQHSHYVNGNKRLEVKADGIIAQGISKASSYFQAESPGTLLRLYNSSWGNATTHDVLYNGYLSNMGDYTYLKSLGNSTNNHGIIVVADSYIFMGRDNLTTGVIDNSATAPISDVYCRIDTSGNALFDGDVVAYSTTIASDARLKENVEDLKYGLKDVLDIRPVSFDWKDKRDGQHDIGVIAQEIEKIIPEVVVEVDTLNSEDTHKTVDYAKLTSVLIKAVQEQQQQINELKEKLNG